MLLANALKKYFENSTTVSNEENIIFGTFCDMKRFWTIRRAYEVITPFSVYLREESRDSS